MNGLSFFGMPLVLLAAPAGGDGYERDILPTAAGDLEITFIGHGSLLFRFGGKAIYVDPVAEFGDFSKLPKADVILIGHDHFDHCDVPTIESLIKPGTELVLSPLAAQKAGRGGTVLKNGESATVAGLPIAAVPAYNRVHMRAPGLPYHPKGDGNGYIVTFGDQRVYIAGDTENIPEMQGFGPIDVAFLPMNLPYTMTPEMVADAARMLRPRILYPYHTTDTDVSKLAPLLRDEPGIEIRIRRMP